MHAQIFEPFQCAGDVRHVRAVGHRVVHGRNIDKALLVDDSVIAAIKDAADLAPLHNPGKFLPSHRAFLQFQEGTVLADQLREQISGAKPSRKVLSIAVHRQSPCNLARQNSNGCKMVCSKFGGHPGCAEALCGDTFSCGL